MAQPIINPKSKVSTFEEQSFLRDALLNKERYDSKHAMDLSYEEHQASFLRPESVVMG